jgi:monoamine oxidase
VRYGRGAKTMLQYRARPWRERCESGDVLTDLDLSTTWDATMTDGATPGILMAYAAGAPGATATKLSPAARIAPPPTMSSASIGARASCSARRARSHGRPSATAAAHTRAWAPGQLTRYWRALRRPAGRLYFAGEHTDRYAGYMEGALCSGLRVAAAIDRRGR